MTPGPVTVDKDLYVEALALRLKRERGSKLLCKVLCACKKAKEVLYFTANIMSGRRRVGIFCGPQHSKRLRLLSFSQSVRARSGSGLASTHVVKLQHAVNVFRLHVKLTRVSSSSDFTTKESDGLSFGQSTSHFQEQVLLEVLHAKSQCLVWNQRTSSRQHTQGRT